MVLLGFYETMKEPHLSLVIILNTQPPEDEFFRDTPREVHESIRRVTRAQRLIVTIQPETNKDFSYIREVYCFSSFIEGKYQLMKQILNCYMYKTEILIDDTYSQMLQYRHLIPARRPDVSQCLVILTPMYNT